MLLGNLAAMYFISVHESVNCSNSTIFFVSSGWLSTEKEMSTLIVRWWVAEDSRVEHKGRHLDGVVLCLLWVSLGLE